MDQSLVENMNCRYQKAFIQKNRCKTVLKNIHNKRYDFFNVADTCNDLPNQMLNKESMEKLGLKLKNTETESTFKMMKKLCKFFIILQVVKCFHQKN